MFLVEVYLRGGAIVEVECEDFETHQDGPLHKVSRIDFVYPDNTKSQVPYIDFDEMVAWKFTEL